MKFEKSILKLSKCLIQDRCLPGSYPLSSNDPADVTLWKSPVATSDL